MSGGGVNPVAGDKADPASVVKDALEQYADLPDEEIVGVGPEDYILQRLHQAGWRVVRTEEIGWTGVDDEHDDGEWFFHFEDEGKNGHRDVRPAFHVTEAWTP